jgi:hypothetical protein
MLYALAACTTLIFVLVLAVPRAARASRLARLFRAQEEWAEMMDDHNAQPRPQYPLAGPWRGPRDGDDGITVPPAESPALALLPSEQPNGRHQA